MSSHASVMSSKDTLSMSFYRYMTFISWFMTLPVTVGLDLFPPSFFYFPPPLTLL